MQSPSQVFATIATFDGTERNQAMRLTFAALFLLVPLVAGCGRSDGSAGADPRETARLERERLEKETKKALESAGDLDDLKKELASDAAKKAASPQVPGNKAAGTAGPGAASDDEGPLRTWTDPAGNALARAELVSLMEGKVCLQKEDGTAAVFPLDGLSAADRQYVKRKAPDALKESPPGAEAEALAAGEDVEIEERSDEEVAGTIGLADARAAAPAPARQEYGTSHKQKVVIPFDFVSKFDQGRYGQMVADSIWKKLEREGGVIIPDSMGDVRDLCTANGRKIGPDTPLSEVGDVVRRDFDADVGIWGSVERAPGAEWEIYDLVIKCVDFSAQPEPKVVYEVSTRTNSVSEIPHLYVKQMLDKLYDRQPGGRPPVDPIAEENWKNNPNLVKGGDFQQGAGGSPVGWAKGWEGGFVGQYEPVGNVVKWIPEAGNPQNRVIRFTMDAALADNTGVPYYSDPFPIEEGAKYRFQCRWRTTGSAVKVFIKCYDEVATEYTPGSAARPSPTRSGKYVPESSQLRECYRSQQNLYGPANTWNTQTQDFTPKHTKYTPRWGRVMLYAYHPAGTVEFDDVVLKQIIPASPSETKKERRHSMASDVTIKEMEENEQRGAEARERIRKGVDEPVGQGSP
jgi:hypothetical protein